MLHPRIVLVAAHYLGDLGGHIPRGCVQNVRDDQPHFPFLLRKQLPLPNPSKSPSTDPVISAMVLREKYQTKTSTSVSPYSSECSLSSAGCGSGNFSFHLVFFPAAPLVHGERLRVVAAVAWIAAIERGVVNLFPYPSLP